MAKSFEYGEYSEFEKTISAETEAKISADFDVMISGNSCFWERSSSEIGDAAWIFRHGWICAQLAARDKGDGDINEALERICGNR